MKFPIIAKAVINVQLSDSCDCNTCYIVVVLNVGKNSNFLLKTTTVCLVA